MYRHLSSPWQLTRRAVSAALVAVVAATALAIVAPITPAGAEPLVDIIDPTEPCGTPHQVVLPSRGHTYRVTVTVTGGAGGRGRSLYGLTSVGGRPATVRATYALPAGTALTLVEGCNGDDAGTRRDALGFSPGGYGGGLPVAQGAGGGGGGSSAICLDPDAVCGEWTTPVEALLVVAGGGGGGGGAQVTLPAHDCAPIGWDGGSAGVGAVVDGWDGLGTGPSGGDGVSSGPLFHHDGHGGRNSYVDWRHGGAGREDPREPDSGGGGGGGGGFAGGRGGDHSNPGTQECPQGSGGGAGSTWYRTAGLTDVVANADPVVSSRIRLEYREVMEPATPRSLVATSRDRSVRLQWVQPDEGPDRQVPVFEVLWRPVGTEHWAFARCGCVGRRFDVDGLVNGMSYEFQVVAQNDWGISRSATVSAVPAAPPSVPGPVSVVWSTVSDQATLGVLSWGASVPDGAPVTGYRVLVDGSEVTATGTTAQVTAQPGRTIQVEVMATSTAGDSQRRTALLAVPALAPAPPRPRLRVDPETAVITADWGRVVHVDPVLSYDVVVAVGGVDRPAVSVAVSDAPTFVVPDVVPGQSYQVRARVLTAWGPGPWSPASVPVVAPGAPSPPGALVATSLTGPPSARLRWTLGAASHPLVNLGQRVVVSEGAAVVFDQDLAANATDVVVPGLRLGHTYSVSVRTWNAVGPSASATAQVTMPGPDVAPFPSIDAFLDRQYQDLVGRAPTGAERASAMDGLELGLVTADELVVALLADSYTDLDASIIRLYLAFLDRPPDRSGLAYWIAQVQSGTRNLDQAAQGFALSSEFERKYGTLGDRAFIAQVYRNVLGREGEAAGIDFWTSQLAGETRGRVVRRISETPENRRAKEVHVDVVRLYQAMLDRTPTLAEFTMALAEGADATAARIRTGAAYRQLVTG